MVHPTPQKLNSNMPSDLPQTTAPIGGSGITSSPPAAPFAQPGTQPGGRTAIQFGIEPANASQAVGSTFQTSVTLANGEDVFAVPLQLQFNPAVLQLVNVDSGPFLGSDGQAVALAHRDEGNGLVALSARRPPNTKGVSGQGTVCILTFKAIAPGDSPITMVKVGASDSRNINIPATGSQAVVHVK
jgi:general secretion pathway protein D